LSLPPYFHLKPILMYEKESDQFWRSWN
jgi:hypothetical protein